MWRPTKGDGSNLCEVVSGLVCIEDFSRWLRRRVMGMYESCIMFCRPEQRIRTIGHPVPPVSVVVMISRWQVES